MNFKDVLERIGSRLDGILGSVVIGEDGIIVERHIVDPNFDVELSGVEYIGGCKAIRQVTSSLESGEVEEFTVVADKSKTLVRTISPGYFIILTMGPEGSLGRGRYELKKAAYELAPEFM